MATPAQRILDGLREFNEQIEEADTIEDALRNMNARSVSVVPLGEWESRDRDIAEEWRTA